MDPLTLMNSAHREIGEMPAPRRRVRILAIVRIKEPEYWHGAVRCTQCCWTALQVFTRHADNLVCGECGGLCEPVGPYSPTWGRFGERAAAQAFEVITARRLQAAYTAEYLKMS